MCSRIRLGIAGFPALKNLDDVTIEQALVATGWVTSRSEARRRIKTGGVYISPQGRYTPTNPVCKSRYRVLDPGRMLTSDDGYLWFGKHNMCSLLWSSRKSIMGTEAEWLKECIHSEVPPFLIV